MADHAEAFVTLDEVPREIARDGSDDEPRDDSHERALPASTFSRRFGSPLHHHMRRAARTARMETRGPCSRAARPGVSRARRAPRSSPPTARGRLEASRCGLGAAHDPQDVAAGDRPDVVVRVAAPEQLGDEVREPRYVLEPVGQQFAAVEVAADADVVDAGTRAGGRCGRRPGRWSSCGRRVAGQPRLARVRAPPGGVRVLALVASSARWPAAMCAATSATRTPRGTRPSRRRRCPGRGGGSRPGRCAGGR